MYIIHDHSCVAIMPLKLIDESSSGQKKSSQSLSSPAATTAIDPSLEPSEIICRLSFAAIFLSTIVMLSIRLRMLSHTGSASHASGGGDPP